MSKTMTVTMDGAGRLVVPKPIREEAGLTPGATLEIVGEEGRVEIRVPPLEVEIVRGDDGLPLARPRGAIEPLDGATVREVLATVRERGDGD